MKKIILPVVFLLLGSAYLVAQPVWTSIGSSRGSFSFALPAYVTPLDTLNLLSYTYVPPTDSSICFQVHYMDQVPVSGNPDLQSYLGNTTTSSTAPQSTDTIATTLNVYAQLFQQFTSGTIEGFDSVSYQSRIRGEELTIRHPDPFGDTTVHYFAFTRYYYYNSRFVAFTVTGPEAELTTLYAYKNQFFSSIGINW